MGTPQVKKYKRGKSSPIYTQGIYSLVIIRNFFPIITFVLFAEPGHAVEVY